MPCEPDGEVEDDTDHGGGDGGKGLVEARVGASAFDERGAAGTRAMRNAASSIGRRRWQARVWRK